jgi:hypothetical protein
MQARYYASGQGRFASVDPVFFQREMLHDPQSFNLYAYARNSPQVYTDPSGLKIDRSRLNKDDLNRWTYVVLLANLKDENGNWVNPELHTIYERLENDTRTFYIENYDFGENSQTIGLTTINRYSQDDFSVATLQLDFKKLSKLDNTTDADLAPGFKKFEGLLGGRSDFGLRLAELFGHEGAHAVYALDNLAESVKVQRLIDQYYLGRMAGKPHSAFSDILQEKDRLLVFTERFAQQREQIVNKELQAFKRSEQNKKKK